MRAVAVALAAAARALAGQAPAAPLPASALTLRGAPAPFWQSERAPVAWPAPLPAVERALRWAPVAPGVERATLPLRGEGEAARLAVTIVRIDTRRHPLRLVVARTVEGGAWSLDSARDAAVAFNAGQFTGASPWGWVVQDGRERLPPQRAPLGVAIAQRRDGSLAWIPNASLDRARASRGDLAWAIQSYPALLDADTVPMMLRGGRALDLSHRDRRLAIGIDRAGRAIVLLTEVDLAALREVPLGLTVPELAALMGAVGCTHAVALDGGISAQLKVGSDTRRGWRRVPLALRSP